MQYKILMELLACKAGDTAPYPTSMVKVSIIIVGHTATFINNHGEKSNMLNGTEAVVATLIEEA